MTTATAQYGGNVVHIARDHKGNNIVHEVVTLTPKLAEEMLRHNTHNRRLSDDDVLKWATEMEQGRWQYNGEAIKVAADGTILDGQHRLTAMTLCVGVTVPVLIISGLENKTQLTMDQGRKRLASQQLGLAGFTSDYSTGAAIKQFILWDEDLLFSGNGLQKARTTAPKLVEWVEMNRDVANLIHEAGSKYRGTPTRSSIVQSSFAIIATSTHASFDVVDEFYTKLSEGAGLESGSPILVLRNRLTKISADRVRVSDRDMLGYFIAAYNHWRKGATIQKLQRPAAGWTADNFPEVYPK